MNMKKIIVTYWHLSKFKDLPYEHNQEFDYSITKRNEIVDLLLSKGYSIMLRSSKDNETLLIHIDNGRFGQK